MNPEEMREMLRAKAKNSTEFADWWFIDVSNNISEDAKKEISVYVYREILHALQKTLENEILEWKIQKNTPQRLAWQSEGA